MQSMINIECQKFSAITERNFYDRLQKYPINKKELYDLNILSKVFPFKVNDYVLSRLINWDNYKNDPIFRLTFPQKEMLTESQFCEIENLIKTHSSNIEIKDIVNIIREELNPNPCGQMECNVPTINGVKLRGLQHKYKETVLFFPSQGQTCHAYCSFCFRWPQFVGINELKFSSSEPELLVKYLQDHPEVSDIIFTGGDPLMMKTNIIKTYFNKILEANLPNLKSIRIGTKSISYWPYRFLTDDDADQLFELFDKVKTAGIHLAIMAHFTHPVELSTIEAQEAITRIINAGIQIRTQSPIIRGINDSVEVWEKKWKSEMKLGCIPYYMFIPRNTGAQLHFSVPLVKAWEIFKGALQNVSGICRTVRGPIMSCTPGKVEVSGVCSINNKKYINLRMIQSRNPDWVLKPFFAEYNENAIWIDDLKPKEEKKFFFEEDLALPTEKNISDH